MGQIKDGFRTDQVFEKTKKPTKQNQTPQNPTTNPQGNESKKERVQ